MGSTLIYCEYLPSDLHYYDAVHVLLGSFDYRSKSARLWGPIDKIVGQHKHWNKLFFHHTGLAT